MAVFDANDGLPALGAGVCKSWGKNVTGIYFEVDKNLDSGKKTAVNGGQQ
jgi:hypothetical protein